MRVQIIASSSTANTALLEAGADQLVLDAGTFPNAVHAAGAEHDRITAVLVTHEHEDHARYAWAYAEGGIDVVATRGTFTAMKRAVPEHRRIPIEHRQTLWLGRWRIVAFTVEHDAAEPVGFLIAHETDTDRALYITDAGKIPGTFRGVTHALVEANYDPFLLATETKGGRTDRTLAERIRKTHLSIYEAEQLLGSLDAHGPYLKEVHLLHLSDAHSDAADFVARIRAATGRPVYVGGHQGAHRGAV